MAGRESKAQVRSFDLAANGASKEAKECRAHDLEMKGLKHRRAHDRCSCDDGGTEMRKIGEDKVEGTRKGRRGMRSLFMFGHDEVLTLGRGKGAT